jgi:nucleotide-binding universal stress UspA family protein
MYRNIIVGTDGSDTAWAAVRHAAELAKALKAQLYVLSAWQAAPTLALAGAAPGYIGPDPGWHAESAERTLAEVHDRLKLEGVEAIPMARQGPAADVLVRTAEELDADLIVVGNRGMHGARRILGSVPNSVAHRAPCAVLVVATT